MQGLATAVPFTPSVTVGLSLPCVTKATAWPALMLGFPPSTCRFHLTVAAAVTPGVIAQCPFVAAGLGLASIVDGAEAGTLAAPARGLDELPPQAASESTTASRQRRWARCLPRVDVFADIRQLPTSSASGRGESRYACRVLPGPQRSLIGAQ